MSTAVASTSATSEIKKVSQEQLGEMEPDEDVFEEVFDMKLDFLLRLQEGDYENAEIICENLLEEDPN